VLLLLLVGDGAYETRAWHAQYGMPGIDWLTDWQTARQTDKQTDRLTSWKVFSQTEKVGGDCTSGIGGVATGLHVVWVWHTMQVTVYGMQVCNAFYLLSIRRLLPFHYCALPTLYFISPYLVVFVLFVSLVYCD